MPKRMKAIEVLNRDSIEYDIEAAHRGSTFAAERIMMRQRDFQEAIRPILKLRADVISLGVPIIRLKPDSALVGSVRYKFTDNQQKQLDQIDALIDQVSQSFVGSNRPK